MIEVAEKHGQAARADRDGVAARQARGHCAGSRRIQLSQLDELVAACAIALPADDVAYVLEELYQAARPTCSRSACR